MSLSFPTGPLIQGFSPVDRLRYLPATVLVVLVAACFLTLPWSLERYASGMGAVWESPSADFWFGTDQQGRSLLWRSLLGGAISLTIGVAATCICLILGVAVGCVAGLAGGRVDSLLMRIVDVLYGLPYILLVVLIHLTLVTVFEGIIPPAAAAALGLSVSAVANMISLMFALSLVSWLTLARVIRGQVLSLKQMPFIEAAYAIGAGRRRILFRHLLPNLSGPILVYATLTIPTVILQESFLSFLGIGIQQLPTWGNLAADGLPSLHNLGTGEPMRWWLIFWPCVLLGATLMGLNLLGDQLQNRVDPRSVRSGRG